MRNMNPVQVTTLRITAGAATLGTVVYVSKECMPRNRSFWGHVAVIAFLNNALPFILLAIGNPTEEDAGIVSVFNASVPLCVLASALAFRRDREGNWRVPAGLAVGFGGVLLMFASWQEGSRVVSWGSGASLAASLAYGASMIHMQWLMEERGIPPLTMSAAQVMMAASWSALTLPWGGLEPVRWTPDSLLGLAVVGVLNNGLVYMLFVRLMHDEGPMMASTVLYVVPVVLVLLEKAIEHTQIPARKAAGIVVALSGVALARWRQSAGRALTYRAPLQLTAAEPAAG